MTDGPDGEASTPFNRLDVERRARHAYYAHRLMTRKEQRQRWGAFGIRDHVKRFPPWSRLPELVREVWRTRIVVYGDRPLTNGEIDQLVWFVKSVGEGR